MTSELRLRQASCEDIPILVRHRRSMAESIAQERGMALDAAAWEVGERTYAAYLQARFASGTTVAWGIESAGRIVASGVVSVLPWPPGAGDHDEIEAQVGLLHSVWTDCEHRRRGCARRVIQAAIEWCRNNKIKRLDLGASEAGRPLYEQMGFKGSTTVMHLPLR